MLFFVNHRYCVCLPAVDEAVIALLDSGNHELVFAACGVLMNLMVDDEKRPKLLEHGGVSKYVECCVLVRNAYSFTMFLGDPTLSSDFGFCRRN